MTSITTDMNLIKELSDEIKGVKVFDERRFSSAHCPVCLEELELIEGNSESWDEPGGESSFYCPECQEHEE